ncbi:MAG TPA: hypothetical protein VNA13_04435 [Xanthomonadales bacterium]|nr:hypothetical protein [Xanthomonadales bacterium]
MQESNGDQQTKSHSSIEHASAETEINILTRTTPLSVSEIATIRSEEQKNVVNKRGRTYKVGDKTVGVWLNPIYVENIPDEEKDKLKAFVASRAEGEVFKHEFLIVNALIEQLRIADKFGLPEKLLYTDLNLEFVDKVSAVTNDWGQLNLHALDEHIGIMKDRGATDEEIIIELSGHIFHEGVHQAGFSEFLDGKMPLGEITTVTSQLAYYLEQGYKGPKAYDMDRFEEGRKKILSGKDSVVDHDIATYTAVNLIHKTLTEEFPQVSGKKEDLDPYTACENIIAQISTEERERLLPVLRRIIHSSVERSEFDQIVENLRLGMDANRDKAA